MILFIVLETALRLQSSVMHGDATRGEVVTQLLWVGSGGFAGAVGRYLVSGWVHRLLPAAQFPWGTVAVNVAGCGLIGLLAGLVDLRQVLAPEARLFLLIGCLGSFTTFSTFGYETLALAREAEILKAAGNVGLQLGAGLAAVWLGYALARVW